MYLSPHNENSFVEFYCVSETFLGLSGATKLLYHEIHSYDSGAVIGLDLTFLNRPIRETNDIVVRSNVDGAKHAEGVGVASHRSVTSHLLPGHSIRPYGPRAQS